MPEHNSGSLAVYDLSIVFFLWHYRTRAWAFAVVIGFHLATWILFRIGIFPWLMIVSGLLFFPADWPRRLVRKWIGAQRVVERGSVREATERRLHPWGHVTLACYVVVQLYLPLRPYLQSESSAWTCQGFDWSWRVMLVEKSGYAEFRAFDPATGQRWRIGATDYLTPRQAQFMAQAPAMIRALARHITADFRVRGYDRIQVFADAYASFNGRPSQRLVDPTVNLADPTPAVWVVALRR